MAGVDCEIISGATKGLNYKPGHVFQSDQYGLPDITNDPTAHAWNKVRLDGDWYLCDCTRPDLAVSESSKKRHITTGSPWESHFLADPDSFLSTHFPLDDGISLVYEQFVENPVSDIRRWTNQMSRHSGFFTFDMRLLTTDKSILEADEENRVVIQLRAPYPMKYTCKLSEFKSKKNYGEKHTMIYTLYDEVTVEILLPKSGEYLFALYAVPTHADDQLSSSSYCIIKCKVVGNSTKNNKSVISNNILGQNVEFIMSGYEVHYNDDSPIITTDNGETTITVDLPKTFNGSDMRYYLAHESNKDISEAKYVYAERDNYKAIFHFNLPEIGDYSFSISINTEEKDWFFGAGYLIRCQGVSSELFPDGDRKVWGPTKDFYDMGLEVDGDCSSTLVASAGRCTLKLKSKSDVVFRYGLIDGSGSRQNTAEMIFMDRNIDSQLTTFIMRFPNTGYYKFDIFASKPGESSSKFVGQWLVHVTSPFIGELYPTHSGTWGPSEKFRDLGLQISGNLSCVFKATAGVCEIVMINAQNIERGYHLNFNDILVLLQLKDVLHSDGRLGDKPRLASLSSEKLDKQRGAYAQELPIISSTSPVVSRVRPAI
ncbi:kyphoscoliosis peptidase-like [Glandiceps talaboti]